MKRPIILHIIPSLMIGGAEKLLIDLLKRFPHHPDNRFEHHVAYFKSGTHLQNLQKNQITSHPLTAKHPFCAWQLLRLVQRLKPTYLHATLWSANFYARLIGKICNIATICTIHSHHNSGTNAYDNWFKLILDQLTYRWATKVVTVSNSIAKQAEYQFKVNPKQIFTILNGIELPKAITTHPQKTEFIVGHVGRLVPVKNQRLLLQAISLLDRPTYLSVKAIIIGEGKLLSDLKKTAHELKIIDRVQFLLSHSPFDYYPDFDCFVLPSHSEGLSIALLEAMSFGVPPIVTSDGPHLVVQDRENGLLCPSNNPYSLANAIIELIENSALRQALAKKAYQTCASKFDIDEIAKQYLMLYQR